MCAVFPRAERPDQRALPLRPPAAGAAEQELRGDRGQPRARHQGHCRPRQGQDQHVRDHKLHVRRGGRLMIS